jgi:hypothetical protein
LFLNRSPRAPVAIELDTSIAAFGHVAFVTMGKTPQAESRGDRAGAHLKG